MSRLILGTCLLLAACANPTAPVMEPPRITTVPARVMRIPLDTTARLPQP